MKIYAKNFLQSPEWAAVNEKIGYQIVWDHDLLMIVKNAKRGRYLEVPGCPKLKNLDTVRQVAKDHHCVFARLRFQLPANNQSAQYFSANRLKSAPFHLHAEHTVIIDLEQSEDTLLKNMRRQTRYEVRRAEKQGITVEKRSDDAIFKEFHAVQSKTAARQHFIPPDFQTLQAEHAAFGENAPIYTAKTAEGQPIAYGLILIHGEEAEYFEAASTNLGRSLPGAYALLWQVMKDLKKQGIKRFNLWGIAPPGVKNHRYSGVTTFKTGFGGEIVEYAHAQDLVINHPRYLINLIIERLRKWKRHL